MNDYACHYDKYYIYHSIILITPADADSVMSSTPYFRVNTIICFFLLIVQHHLVIYFSMTPIQGMIWSCILVTVMLVLFATVFKIFRKGKDYRKAC